MKFKVESEKSFDLKAADFSSTPERRRRMICADQDQVASLNHAYEKNTRPRRADMEELAKAVGLDSKWIARWFIRKRRDAKKALANLSASNSDNLNTQSVGDVSLSNYSKSESQSLVNIASYDNSLLAPEAYPVSSTCSHGPLCTKCQIGFATDATYSAPVAPVFHYYPDSFRATPLIPAQATDFFQNRNAPVVPIPTYVSVPPRSLTFGYIPFAFPAFPAPLMPPQIGNTLISQISNPTAAGIVGPEGAEGVPTNTIRSESFERNMTKIRSLSQQLEFP